MGIYAFLSSQFPSVKNLTNFHHYYLLAYTIQYKSCYNVFVYRIFLMPNEMGSGVNLQNMEQYSLVLTVKMWR